MSDYHVFDIFQDAVLVIDGEGRVFFGNPAASLLFEVSARRMSSGKPLSQFVTFEPDPVADAGPLSGVLEATQVKEVSFESSSGKKGWAQVTIQPQPEFFTLDPEERARWIVCLRDVSLEKTLHDKYKAELDKKEAVIRDLEIARSKLEDYSHNLEKMVEERTAEIVAMNRLLKAILDSLGQGILVFDSTGVCLPVFSAVCRKILEREPAGLDIESVLSLSGEDRDSFVSWREAVFADLLEFDELVPLAPSQYGHSQGLSVALSYNPMRAENGQIQGVVLVATDRTREEEALREAARERDLVRKVVQVARHRESFRTFAEDAQELLLELKTPQHLDRDDLARRLHTLKGGAASFALSAITSACHSLETRLKSETLEEGASRDEFHAELAQVSTQILELLDEEIKSLTDLLGPLGYDTDARIELPIDRLLGWSKALFDVTTPDQAWVVGREILSISTESEMGRAVAHLEESLRELANGLGKRIAEFRIEGGDTRAPTEPMQPLLSSLVHAFRNSVDHGLEMPADRAAAGKSEGGTLGVRFDRKPSDGGDEITIEIRDDGRGVDPEKIRAKLRRLGMEALADASDDEVIQAILRDDFSTTETVTELSGRGVGLSAISEEARKLGGAARVTSKLGEGMCLLIKVPVPKAALSAFSRAS